MTKQIKLNDVARRILVGGIQNSAEPRVVPAIDFGRTPIAKTVDSLLNRSLLVRLRADHACMVIERDGKEWSLQVTDAGFAACNMEPTEADGPDPVAAGARAGCMPKKYHDLYMAQGGGCADPIDRAMKDAFLTASREVTARDKDGRTTTRTEAALDCAAMARWGREIGLWNDRWDSLNPGMQRMNLTNRVRAAVRKGAKIELRIKQGKGKGTTVRLEVAPKAA